MSQYCRFTKIRISEGLTQTNSWFWGVEFLGPQGIYKRKYDSDITIIIIIISLQILSLRNDPATEPGGIHFCEMRFSWRRRTDMCETKTPKYVHGHVGICMYVCMYVCMDVWMYVWMYVCMYGCMDVYIYIYIYIYTYTYIERERKIRRSRVGGLGIAGGGGGAISDGIGTPNPNPRNLVNWCFWYKLVDITLFWTGCLGL